MIPEQYIQLARRWAWLIALCGVLGAAAGIFVIPSVVGTSAAYNSTATLAVSQYIPLARFVDDSSVGPDSQILAAYTDAVASYADSPQFRSDVSARLAATAEAPSNRSIDRMLKVTANPTLFRLTVEVQAGSAALAEAVATAAAEQLIAHATDQEAELSAALAVNLEAQREKLILHLEELAENKAAGIGDIAAENLEAGVLRSEIEGITAQLERMRIGETLSLPLVMAGAPQTVHTDGATLSPRDMLLLGAVGGLVAGWGAASLAERVMASRAAKPGTRVEKSRPPTPAAAPPTLESVPAPPPERVPAFDLQLVKLAERAADIERRARRLDERLGNGGARSASSARSHSMN
jgi:hypothetical protein